MSLEGLTPFTTLVDLEAGLLDPERDVVERRLSHLRGLFLVEPDSQEDRLVYRVYGIPVPETNSNVFSSTTVIEPGKVGDEYFMTRGHFHEARDRGELYIGLAGDGRLVLATEDGRWTVEPMRRGTVNYIPGGWAHRSVNVGTEPLVFFAAYVADAGYDYATIERRGFPVLVVERDGAPQVVENPRYGS